MEEIPDNHLHRLGQTSNVHIDSCEKTNHGSYDGACRRKGVFAVDKGDDEEQDSCIGEGAKDDDQEDFPMAPMLKMSPPGR